MSKVRRKYDHLELLIEERDRLYTQRFAAQEQAARKAEEVQHDYNVTHNDLTHKIESAYKETMPRDESLALHRTHDDKLATFRAQVEKKFDTLETQIISLREANSKLWGEKASITTMIGFIIGAVGILVAVAVGIGYILKP